MAQDAYGNYRPNIISESLDYERPDCSGGGGGVELFVGTGEPPAVPTSADPGFELWPDPAPAVAQYYDRDTAQIWEWFDGGWHT